MNPVALYKISYGLYIISSKSGDKLNGQIANTVNQVTATPEKIAIALNKENLTHDYILESKVFSASILSQDAPMELIGQFGFKTGRDVNKFTNIEYKLGKTGAPIVLDHTISFIEAELVDTMDVGTHTIMVGKVVDADVMNQQEPMTYAYYHWVKGGKSPKNAPTYQAGLEEATEQAVGEKYKCQICGYIYDPEKGDPEHGVDAGTTFADLHDSWVCPICGAAKDKFDPV